MGAGGWGTKPPTGRRYTKHTLVFATEIFGISPAAYRMLRRSKAVTLPRETVNQGTYNLLGGAGIIYLEGMPLFLMYDYVHIFKNVRNNWYTEATRELIFSLDGKEYIACWDDIVTLYKEDQKTPIRLTKLTQISVSPKPLQRQSVPLVSKVFNDKTVAAFKSLKGNKSFAFSEGTHLFVSLITNWFKMMNVKDTISHVKVRDAARSPWTPGCETLIYTK